MVLQSHVRGVSCLSTEREGKTAAHAACTAHNYHSAHVAPHFLKYFFNFAYAPPLSGLCST